MWHSADGMGWWMALGSVWMVFFWALVVWCFFRFTSRGTEHAATALETLKGRYARGELTREQYQEMRRDLDA